MSNERHASEKPACQHCGREVVWGKTELGFAGFVHVDTNKATCTKES